MDKSCVWHDTFDPNAPAEHNGNLFGLSCPIDEAEVVIIPVPWEPTVSYRRGTSGAPDAILEASYQVDMYDIDFPDTWKKGIALKKDKTTQYIAELNRALCVKKETIDYHLKTQFALHIPLLRKAINDGSAELNALVMHNSLQLLGENKRVAVLGGDHSSPLGLMAALADHVGSYGILHIDAHFDLRDAYQGFEFSHASIMRHASKIDEVERIVHVAARDYCQEEADYVKHSERRHIAFTDSDLKRKMFGGTTWESLCHRSIVPCLPPRVYVSFDIDGLDPSLCPHTGTPVPGGLGFEQALYLLEAVRRSGREIIGFDLSEVAGPTPACPDVEWDAIVGARILWRLSCLMAS